MTQTNNLLQQYMTAMDELEKKACCGEVSLAEAKQEIFRLREKYTFGLPPSAVWPFKRHDDGPPSA
jgi:hypothetical protein